MRFPAIVTGLLLAHASLEAQSATTLRIVNLGDAVEVRQQGRVLGRTPSTLNLPAGVHRLTVGQREHCVVLPPGVSAEMILVGGAVEDMKGAIDCESAWSEVVVASLPAGVTMAAGGNIGRPHAGGVAARVSLPHRIALTFAGERYVPYETTVEIGAREIVRYNVRLGPPKPALLSDTILLRPPPEPAAPTPPTYPAAPADPSPMFANVSSKLAIVNSARPAAVVSTMGAVTFIGAGVAALVFNSQYIKDTITPDPALARKRDIAAGVALGGGLITLSMNAIIRGKVKRAGCGTKASECQRTLQREAEQLRQETLTFPQRRTDWNRDKQRQDSAYRATQAAHAVRRQEWQRQTAEVERRNAAATANRLTNLRTLASWEQRARAAQGLTLISRTPRP